MTLIAKPAGAKQGLCIEESKHSWWNLPEKVDCYKDPIIQSATYKQI